MANNIIGVPNLRSSYSTIALSANNTTASVVVFTLTGVVRVYDIWGVVSTVIGSNHTAGYLQLNDQTATPDITLATGVTLSSLAVGTLIYKEGMTADALKLKDNAAGFFEEPASAGASSTSPFIIGKKTGAVTTIDYRYSTTNTPTTGGIRWGVTWFPWSDDGNLA